MQLPLGAENANTRKAAIAVLQAMLAQPELAARRDGSPAVTPEFVRAALAALTGPELVQLLDWADIAPSAPQLSWCVPPADPIILIANVTGLSFMVYLALYTFKWMFM